MVQLVSARVVLVWGLRGGCAPGEPLVVRLVGSLRVLRASIPNDRITAVHCGSVGRGVPRASAATLARWRSYESSCASPWVGGAGTILRQVASAPYFSTVYCANAVALWAKLQEGRPLLGLGWAAARGLAQRGAVACARQSTRA